MMDDASLIDWITIFVCAAMAFTWIVQGWRQRKLERMLSKRVVRIPPPVPSGEHHRAA